MLRVVKYWSPPGMRGGFIMVGQYALPPRYYFYRYSFVSSKCVGTYDKAKDIIHGYKKQISWKWREE